MMRTFHTVLHLLTTAMVFLASEEGIYAQHMGSVQEGEVFLLAVIPVAGETYVWEVYYDYTLDTVAVPPDVIFLAGQSGASVPVEWGTAGTYYYTVTAFSAAGCMNLKVGMLKVERLKEAPFITIRVDRNPICAGQPVIFSARVSQSGTTPVYQWFRNGEKVGANMASYPDDSLKNRDVVWCELTNTTMKYEPVTVASNEITMVVETVNAAFSVTDNVGNVPGRVRFTNQSAGADYFYWTFGNGYTSIEKDPTVTYTEDGTYRILLMAMNPNYCTDSVSYLYTLLFKGLYIPNAFAPTVTDGIGGTFRPTGINLRRYRIEIFDNWGHLIWESSGLDELGRPAEAWDGTMNGTLMPQGTYVWKIQAEFVDGTQWEGSDAGNGHVSTLGTVTLLR